MVLHFSLISQLIKTIIQSALNKPTMIIILIKYDTPIIITILRVDCNTDNYAVVSIIDLPSTVYQKMDSNLWRIYNGLV